MPSSRNENQLYFNLLLIAASFALSALAVLRDPVINDDGVFYLMLAQQVADRGVGAAFALFDRPLYAILIAALHQSSGLSLLASAHVLDAALLALLVVSFTRFAVALCGDRGLGPWVALLVLLFPQLNGVPQPGDPRLRFLGTARERTAAAAALPGEPALAGRLCLGAARCRCRCVPPGSAGVPRAAAACLPAGRKPRSAADERRAPLCLPRTAGAAAHAGAGALRDGAGAARHRGALAGSAGARHRRGIRRRRRCLRAHGARPPRRRARAALAGGRAADGAGAEFLAALGLVYAVLLGWGISPGAPACRPSRAAPSACSRGPRC